MTPYEFIEHTADIAIRAWAEDTPAAFAATAQALSHLLTDGADIQGRERIEFRTESVDREGLLVGMLSELILRFDADGQVCGDFQVHFVSDTRGGCGKLDRSLRWI